MIRWLLIIITGYVCFTIGTHLLAFNGDSIGLLLNEGIWPDSKGKSLISGLLLAIPAMFLVKYLLDFKQAIFEPYAFTIPLGIAIQRLGCLAAGCCYGKPTDLPFGISYEVGHWQHYLQWKNGMIADQELVSIAIHPVQIYESILCLLILGLIIFFYRNQWFKNQLVYVSFLLYSIVRFITEFFRAAEAHTIGLKTYFMLNTVQWIMIIAVAFFLYKISRIYKSDQGSVGQKSSKSVSIKEYIWFILLFSLLLITPDFYSRLELFLLGLLFVPLSALIFWQLFKLITVPQFRLATVSICVLAIFIMGQNSPKAKKKSKNKYHEVSIGGNVGSNTMTHYYTTCSGNQVLDFEYKEKYVLGGIGYKYVNEVNTDEKITVGVNGSYGNIKEGIDGIDVVNQQYSYSISPFITYDMKKIGFGLGVMVGDMYLYRDPGYYDTSIPLSILKNYSLLPKFHFRVGNLKKTWGEVNYGFKFPGVSPASEFEILMGVRGENGNLVRIGTSAFHAIVIRPKFYIKGNLGIEPYFGLFGPLINESFTDRNGIEAGVNLHYRIRQVK